jgi:hypothetical protein
VGNANEKGYSIKPFPIVLRQANASYNFLKPSTQSQSRSLAWKAEISSPSISLL